MSVSAIAIVGKDNRPLIIRTRYDYETVNPVLAGSHDHPLDEENGRMKLIHLLHASLDVIDEKQHQLQNREPYLGLLNQCESFKIYGLLSTTKVKIIVLVSSGSNVRDSSGSNVRDLSGSNVRDLDAKSMLKQIQSCYIQSTVSNPFYTIGSEIKSKSLEELMKQILSR